MSTAAVSVKAHNNSLGYTCHSVARSCHSTSLHTQPVLTAGGTKAHSIAVGVYLTAAHGEGSALAESTELCRLCHLAVKVYHKPQLVPIVGKGSKKPDKNYYYHGDNQKNIALFKHPKKLLISIQNLYHPLR